MKNSAEVLKLISKKHNGGLYMSALVIGMAFQIGIVGDLLLENGFNEVRFKVNASAGSFELKGYRPDMLILMKEVVLESEISRVIKKAAALNIPVFLWLEGMEERDGLREIGNKVCE